MAERGFGKWHYSRRPTCSGRRHCRRCCHTSLARERSSARCARSHTRSVLTASRSSVAPGLTDTPGSRTVHDADFEAVVGHQALRRRLVPEDTAEVVAFLASDGGAVMTGQVLCADAGLILR